MKWGGFTSGGKFDSSGAYLYDAFIRYLGFDNIILTFGQHTEPFSLEQQTSSLNITFMERALPSALTPGSTVGLSAAFLSVIPTGLLQADFSATRFLILKTRVVRVMV